jgi:ABC-2 type transport system ATP-binding protein
MSRPVGLRAAGTLSALVAGAIMTLGVLGHRSTRIDQAGLVMFGLLAFAACGAAVVLFKRAALAAEVAATPFDVVHTPRASPSNSAIAIEGLAVRYGTRVALRGISLSVAPGEVVGLLGPNGAGKTTTVEVCCGLRKPDAGAVRVLGLDTTTQRKELRRVIGVVPQDSGLYPELTGREHLELFAALYGLAGSTRVDEVLELVGLADRASDRVSGYSGGMRRRLALGRALLHDPKVLFLDEPTLGVDVHGRRALWEHVIRLAAEGRSILITTNYLEEATALCDRVVIIDKGVVLADERPAVLRRKGGSTVVLGSAGDPAVLAAAVRDSCGIDADIVDGLVRVPVAADELTAAVIAAAGAIGPLTVVRTEEPSLEEVFLRLTGRDLDA